jgi:cytochrome c oxidase subunit IV
MSATTHQLPIRVYLIIFGALMVLTGVTVWVAFHDFGAWNNVIALGIAATKAALVILYFMHVKYSSRFTGLIVGAAFFWLAILIVFTMGDFMTRSWINVLGG